jgi:geranylgeranyl reductase family protein
VCAAELEKLGENVIVIEKDKRIGEPVECAGLFNIDGLERLGIKKGPYVLNEAKGARFISASGAFAEIKAKESKAYVTDRGEFDRFLAKRYKGELILGEAVTAARRVKDGFEVATPRRKLEGKKVVIATGHDTTIHKFFGLEAPKRFVSTAQCEIKGVTGGKDFVELYVGSVAPGFFAWVIPVSDDTARVGVGVLAGNVHEHMEGFLKRLKKEGRFKEKNKVLCKSGGLIPFYEPDLTVEKNGAYLVGDAAGQVKATTGGGVMIGCLAAKALARAIHDGSSYEKSIEAINKELYNHLLIRNVINKFGDEQYEHMVEFLNRPEIKKIIEEKGDMDFVGPLMEAVMSNPAMMMQALKFMGKGVLF